MIAASRPSHHNYQRGNRQGQRMGHSQTVHGELPVSGYPTASWMRRHSLAIALTREKGAGGYVVNRRCAEVFLEKLLPIRVAWDIAFDIEYLMGLRSVFVEPVPKSIRTPVWRRKSSSPRSASKLSPARYLTVFPYRAYLESSRIIRRGMRLIWKKISQRAS